MTFQILVVCTGNICRSPQAEQLFRRGFASNSIDASVNSAGTMALIGKPMPAQAATLSREYGGDPSTHRGRFLTSDMLAEHDLVIAMSREHRSAIARLLPRAAKYAFTLRELARIAEGMNLESEQRRLPNLPSTSSDSSLSAWMTKAVQSRGRFAATPTYDDVIDPYKRDDDTYRKSIEQIAPAVDVLVNSWADRR